MSSSQGLSGKAWLRLEGMVACAACQPLGHGEATPFCSVGICVWCLEIVYFLLSADTEFKHSAVQSTLHFMQKMKQNLGVVVWWGSN